MESLYFFVLLIAAFILGCLFGAFIAFLWIRPQMSILQRNFKNATSDADQLRQENQGLREKIARLEEQQHWLEQAERTADQLRQENQDLREKVARLEEQQHQLEQAERIAEQLRQENVNLRDKVARLEEQQYQQQWLEQASQTLEKTFQALASQVLQQALQTNSDEFIRRAHDQLSQILTEARGSLFQPLESSLSRLQQQVQKMEERNTQAYGSLEQQLKQLAQSHWELQKATTSLSEAFRKSPTVRGAWGEIQLRRIVEYVGMEEYIDFQEQPDAKRSTGERTGRPDMVVYLPNNRVILIDAKAPLQHFLEAMEASDEQSRNNHLQKYAQAVRDTIRQLSTRDYWQEFANSLEFVVMFVPIETALSYVFQCDPGLLDEAFNRRVLVTGPITLVALLKTVAHCWAQHQSMENAQEVINEGRELYKRICKLTEHINNLGNSLSGAVNAYNQMIGSLESRVFPSVRRLSSLKLGTGEIPELTQVERVPRSLALPEIEIASSHSES